MTEPDKKYKNSQRRVWFMQTTLVKRNVFQVQDHLQNKSESMNHFAKIYEEWKIMQNYNQTEKLKRFEQKHGTAFIQLLALFDKMVEA